MNIKVFNLYLTEDEKKLIVDYKKETNFRTINQAVKSLIFSNLVKIKRIKKS